MTRSVNVSNIQGSIWPRLPKYWETFLFFKVKDEKEEEFKDHLRSLVADNRITTGHECEEFLKNEFSDHLKKLVAANKITADQEREEFVKAKGGLSEARERVDTLPKDRKTFNAINIAFTGKGVNKLVGEYTELKLRDLLHERGMYQDLVFEGPDEPERLGSEYKPPPNWHKNNDNWRADGLFIVAAQRKDELDKTIQELKDYFHIGKEDASAEITVTKEGNVRNADGKAEKTGGENLRGKEHFGYEDQISQPQIKDLDEEPNTGEPKAIPPGWILLGHEGDNTGSPEWANDGSYLVFREIEENVSEFNKFVRTESDKLEGFKDGTGEKLAAYMLGRWKNGSPVELDDKDSQAKHPFANNFDYSGKYSSPKDVKCPFAAHIRKMRPRADLYVGSNGDDHVTAESNTVENSNVILRRSITFGPEYKEGEEKQKRGIYFLCYQADLRNGFNFLVTRWASNKVFASKKGLEDSPGVDPIVSQRSRPTDQGGTFCIYDKDEKPNQLKLGYLPWIEQKGGEYFFTPSLKALKTVFVEEVP